MLDDVHAEAADFFYIEGNVSSIGRIIFDASVFEYPQSIFGWIGSLAGGIPPIDVEVSDSLEYEGAN